MSKLLPTTLNENKDVFVWQWSKASLMSSLYRDIMNKERVSRKKNCSGGLSNLFFMRLSNLYLKVKIYLKRAVVLQKITCWRGWRGDTKCRFGLEETIQHLFFDCQIARMRWNSLYISFNLQPPKSAVHFVWFLVKKLSSKIKKTSNSGCGGDVVGIAIM